MAYTCKCQCESFREHVMGINIAPSATAKGRVVAEQNRMEKQMPKDHAAYRRMKAEGFQPKSVTNAARVEANADSAFEIERGKVLTKAQQLDRKVTERIMDDTGVGKITGNGLR